ncbi:MAG: 6-hydroxycyclohex-1-ene-1-carbonyl-CoA dehydrogenase, partial [Patescibacteria group bacterium]
DARAIGNWGCDPTLYPEVLELVRKGKVKIKPFVEIHPLSEINLLFEKAHARKLSARAVLVPDGMQEEQ